MLKVLSTFAIFCTAVSAQPQGRFGSVNGTRIYYEECGESGVNLVLLHDGLASFDHLGGRVAAALFEVPRRGI